MYNFRFVFNTIEKLFLKKLLNILVCKKCELILFKSYYLSINFILSSLWEGLKKFMLIKEPCHCVNWTKGKILTLYLMLPLALRALNPEHQLLGGLRLSPEDRFGLSSEALLLPVVPSPTLGLLTLRRLLVLCHLVHISSWGYSGCTTLVQCT